MKDSAFFTREVVTAEPDEPISSVAVAMQKHHVGAVVVVEQQRPVGIITDRDIAIALGARGLSTATPAQDLMTCPVETIKQSEGVFSATRHVRESTARRLPVVDDAGRLVGLVTFDDLILLLGREMNNLAQAIRPEMAVV